MKILTTVCLGLLFSNSVSWAKSCPQVILKRAESCSQLTAEYDFRNCSDKSLGIKPAKIECREKEALVTYSRGGQTWSKSYVLVSNNWGDSSWNSKGPVTLKVRELASKDARPLEKEVPPVEKPALKIEEVKEKNLPVQFQFNGYVDFRLTGVTNKDNPLTTKSGNQESGFSLEEAALFVTAKKAEDFQFYLDLPIRRSKGSDNESNDGNLGLGLDNRSQVYFKFPLGAEFNLTAGQFDTPYGVELNDSKDRVFAKTGLLYDYALPVTHTGLLLDKAFGSAYLKFLIANSNNKESLGSSTDGDNHFESGLSIGFSNENYRTQFGYLRRQIKNADDTHGGQRSLLDFTLGATWGLFSIDLEWAQVTNDRKNTLTPTDSADKEDPGQVFLILPTVKLGDSWLLGLRYENLDNDPASANFEKAQSYG
ncbi:MAG: porin, partial [Bdellovibrionales bacterium]